MEEDRGGVRLFTRFSRSYNEMRHPVSFRSYDTAVATVGKLSTSGKLLPVKGERYLNIYHHFMVTPNVACFENPLNVSSLIKVGRLHQVGSSNGVFVVLRLIGSDFQTRKTRPVVRQRKFKDIFATAFSEQLIS
jgi:hypothetical protein